MTKFDLNWVGLSCKVLFNFKLGWFSFKNS